MIELYIDNERVSLVSEPSVEMSYDTLVYSSIDDARKGRSVTLQIEVKPESRWIFGGEGYLHVAQKFNAESHSAYIASEGVVLVEGSVVLRSSQPDYTFTIEIVCSGAEWAESAYDTMINTMEMEYSMGLRPYDIKQMWSQQSPVQYFPVHRDDYVDVLSGSASGVVQRSRTIDDYHPFLNIGDMMRSATESAEYQIESDLLDTDEFKATYMSGSYVSQSNDVLKNIMDFYIKKVEDQTATADSSGRVTISPGFVSQGIDSFVDIESLTSDSECFSTGGYLAMESGALQFTPPVEVTMGFEYRIKYRAACTIESSTLMSGFNEFFLNESPEIQIDVVNPYTDIKDSQMLIQDFQYYVVVCDPTSTDDEREMKILAYDQSVGDYSEIASWTGESTIFTLPDDVGDTSDYQLWILEAEEYVQYDGDWAIYEGYVAGSVDMEFDITVRTSPRTVSPSSPMTFDFVYFENAESGAELTLLAGTSIAPYFAAAPGYGDTLSWEDVSQHSITQGDLMDAMQHLYNLRFYSDSRAKRVYIDPRDELYGSDGVVWDWSDRVQQSESIVFEDVANDEARVRTWGYQDGDGVTNRSAGFNYTPEENFPPKPEDDPMQDDPCASSPEYGAWSRTIESMATSDSSLTRLSPIFSPTQNDLDGIPIVGDRDDAETSGTLEFTPRIVQYIDMQWSDGEQIPLVSFHDADAEVSFCFEDRDGIAGLNKYYTQEIRDLEVGQYVTLTLRIEPHEMANLLSPVEGAPSVLSHFALIIGGEWAECRIESIVSYKLGESTAKVKMLIIK